jgi:hypothetical protein
MKNRWGDPLLVHYPVSKIAVWAFVLSVLALVCAAILFVSPSDQLGRPIYGAAGAVLLTLLQLLFTTAGMTLAYIAFLSRRINDLRPGRGLAWAALAASYMSILYLSAILVALVPILGILSLAVVVIAMLHVLAFSAESTFARNAVTCSLIGATFISLVSCGLIQSREQARRLQCQKNLQEIGLQLSEVMETQQHVQDHHAIRAYLTERLSSRQQSAERAFAPPTSVQPGATIGRLRPSISKASSDHDPP